MIAQWRIAWLRALVILPLLALGGCASSPEQQATMTPVPIPNNLDVTAVAWVDDWLVVAVQPFEKPTAFSARLWRMRLDGSDAEPLPVPDYPGCHRQGHEAPTRLPSGQLGYMVACFPAATSAISRLHLMSYDMRSGESRSLLRYPLPSSQVGTGGYSWNPPMTRGITSDGNGRGLSEQLYWFMLDRWEALDVGMPQAFGASWSPDGTRIAFLGAREQGLSGVGRVEAVFNLYLMNADGSNMRPLVEGIRYVSSTDWSPGGRWIVLHGVFGRLVQERGVWLIEVATGKRTLIQAGQVVFPRWSPDGRRLVAIQHIGEYSEGKRRLVLLDVAPRWRSE